MDYQEIIRHFRLGTIDKKKVYETLQVHGFPSPTKAPKIAEEIEKILTEDRKACMRNRKRGNELLEDTVEKLEKLLREWQRDEKRKKKTTR